MATTVLKNSHTIRADGVTTDELLATLLPKGTIIQVLSAACSAKAECKVVGAAGEVIFHSYAPLDNTWDDRMVLNRDVRGCVVSVLGGTTTYVYFFLPAGRIA